MDENTLLDEREIVSKSLKMVREEKTYHVYFLINKGKIVYVGQTGDLGTRLSTHQKDKIFDSYFAIETTKEDVTMLEIDYIGKFKPPYNSTIPTNDRYLALSHICKKYGLFPSFVKKEARKAGIFPIFKQYYDFYLLREVLGV